MAANILNYGGNRDGITDNTPALFAALTAESSVYFPGGGTYFFNSNPGNFLQHIRIFGDGIDITKFKIGGNLPYQLMTFLAGGEVCDLTIDGNYAALLNNTAAVISLSPNSHIHNVKIYNFFAMGIDALAGDCTISDCIIQGVGDSIHSTYGVWAISPNVRNVRVIDNHITNCSLNAIWVSSGIVSGNFVQGNAINNAGGQIGIGNATNRAICSNNIIEAGGSFVASGIECTGNANIIGNQIRGQQQYGIVLEQDGHIQVTGNEICNSGNDAILVCPNISDFEIIGNRCYDSQASKTQKYGLRISSGTSDRFSVIGNDFSDNVNPAGWIDLSTGSKKTFIGNLPGASCLTQNSDGDVMLGDASVMSVSARSGFPRIPNIAGRPTQSPWGISGYNPIVYNCIGKELCIYDNGDARWRFISAI